MEANWVIIFIFPPVSAGIIIFFDKAAILKPVTINSLAIITIAIHASIRAVSTRTIRADIIKSLSAMGSRSTPNFVTCFDFLAIYPSRMSVADAKTNMKDPSSGFVYTTEMKRGIRSILPKVITVGKLTNRFPGYAVPEARGFQY